MAQRVLTDKYDIVRGINTGANHEVSDLTESVNVYAGREFWSWLNWGENDTQYWVLNGILQALRSSNIRAISANLLANFKEAVKQEYSIVDDTGVPQWNVLLDKIN